MALAPGVTMEEVVDLTTEDELPPTSRPIVRPYEITSHSCCTSDMICDFLGLLKKRNDQIRTAPRIHWLESFFFVTLDARGVAPLVRWARNADLWNMEAVFLPLHTPENKGPNQAERGHWTLITIFPKAKVVRAYDPLGREHKTRLRQVLTFLQVLAEKNEMEFDPSNWKLKGNPLGLPLQTNAHDCGFFLILYAACIARGEDPADLPQPNSCDLRKAIASGLRRKQVEPLSGSFTSEESPTYEAFSFEEEAYALSVALETSHLEEGAAAGCSGEAGTRSSISQQPEMDWDALSDGTTVLSLSPGHDWDLLDAPSAQEEVQREPQPEEPVSLDRDPSLPVKVTNTSHARTSRGKRIKRRRTKYIRQADGTKRRVNVKSLGLTLN